MPNANSFQNTLGNSFTDTLGNSGVTPNAFRQNFDNHVRGDKFDGSSFGDPFKSKNVGGHGTKTNKGGAYSETTTVSSSSSDDWEKGFDNDSGKNKKKKSKFHNDEHKAAYKRARKYIKNNLKGDQRKQAMKRFKKDARNIDWSDNSSGAIFHSQVDPATGKPVVSGGANDTPWLMQQLEGAKDYVMDSKISQNKKIKPDDVGMSKSTRRISTAKLGKYGILNELASQAVDHFVMPHANAAIEKGVKGTAEFFRGKPLPDRNK